ncbi:Protein REVERSION-TO-ETHYLENE SENSITIVITY1 [Orobanche gracilis]
MRLQEHSLMELEPTDGIENKIGEEDIVHDLWPLGPIDPKKAKFPCCLVWTPLPVVSWLAPFIGHVGICMEDGTILDFSGSNFVNVDDFAFGSVARYLQLDREQCCFPPNIAGHKCKHRFAHSEFGAAITWDDALQSTGRNFEHKSHNLFTCNCHSFVASCLNRLCYRGSMNWNMVDVWALVVFNGKWVDGFSVLRSSLPFLTALCFGVYVVGWPFLIGLFSFSFLLVGWFLLATYCFKNLLEC